MWKQLKRCPSSVWKYHRPIISFLSLCVILKSCFESHRTISKLHDILREHSNHGVPNEGDPSMKDKYQNPLVREEPNDIHNCSAKLINPKWGSSKNLPQWIKDHFAWHSERRCLDGLDGSNSKETKYLLIQCLQSDGQCGGIADRLKPLALAVLFANMTNRVLLFHWDTPCALEEFLVPPENGIDWRFPEWLESDRKIHSKHVKTRQSMMANIESNIRIIKASLQIWDGGSHFFDENAGCEFGNVYGDIFHALFEPSQHLSKEISSTMDSLGLVDSQYTAAHMRAKYPRPGANLKGEDGKTLHEKEGQLVLEGKTKDYIIRASTNAVYCASKIFPEAKKVYFSSDSYQTIEYVLKDSEFSKESSPLEVVAYDHDDEPLHLDSITHKNETSTSFFPAFIDLFILSMSKCVSVGMGGYGRFGAAIRINRNESCAIQHTNHRGRIYTCPNVTSGTKE